MERLSSQENQEDKLNEVAAHEMGHADVAKKLGGLISKITIIPKGETLGYVIASFEHFPFHEKIHRMMAVLAAGYVAEERIGKSDHRGTGSDMAKLENLATIASRIIYLGRVSTGSLVSEAFSRARNLMPGYYELCQRAKELELKGTIV